MDFDLAETIALLRHTPATLDALLRDLPNAWTLRNEGEGTWSPCEVVGHLIHADRTNWMPRVRRLLEAEDVAPLGPFDRWGHLRESGGKPVAELLDAFARLRADRLRELRDLNLGPRELARQGRHPTLGEVTVANLLATWAAHDLTHLHQISRTMAHQYRDAVGPFRDFLGVLHCAGHSAP